MISSLGLLVFTITLFSAVLLSRRAYRTVLSSSVLFLLVGFITGDGMLDLATIEAGNDTVALLVKLALFSVLFTDGMRIQARELKQAWRLPGRALLLGMPLTFFLLSGAAKVLLGLPWLHAMLVATVLSPTDPVMASQIISRSEIPPSLRRLLNVESGLNDGIALPIVIVLIELIKDQPVEPLALSLELLGGVAIGILIPIIAVWLESTDMLGPHDNYMPLHAFAVGAILLAVTNVTHTNPFLAAFCGGVTMASISEHAVKTFHEFGELVAELLKLAALFVYGIVLLPATFLENSLASYLFAIFMLFLARPLAILISLEGSELPWTSKVTAAWFGPKGFASIFYALIIWQSGISDSEALFSILSLAIVMSILVHSSTDSWFAQSSRLTGSAAHDAH